MPNCVSRVADPRLNNSVDGRARGARDAYQNYRQKSSRHPHQSVSRRRSPRVISTISARGNTGTFVAVKRRVHVARSARVAITQSEPARRTFITCYRCVRYGSCRLRETLGRVLSHTRRPRRDRSNLSFASVSDNLSVRSFSRGHDDAADEQCTECSTGRWNGKTRTTMLRVCSGVLKLSFLDISGLNRSPTSLRWHPSRNLGRSSWSVDFYWSV